MGNSNLISIPLSLSLKIHEELRKKEIEPRFDKNGLLSCEFTNEELAMIDTLVFENPGSGNLKGIELLPNLKHLTIKSKGNGSYTQEKNLASISDEDGYCISKCHNLVLLEIENQTKLSFIDVEELKNLNVLSLNRNARLEEIYGLESLTKLYELGCVGNESLTQIKDLDKIILNNTEMDTLNLDLLLFPDAVGYNIQNMDMNQDVLQKFSSMTITWEEILSSGKNIKINNSQMMMMHKKACEALLEYVPQYCGKETAVLGIEQYLSENVKYDYKAVDSESHSHFSTFSFGDKEVNMLSGPLGGANGAFNAFIYNTCVCEGYTRAMQYLLRLEGIKSHNVHCISGEDTLHMSSDKGDNQYKIYNLPDDGYHSIISVDDIYCLYDDPCWNAGRYQRGDKSMPWVLRTKNEISKDHTLSFGERNIDNNTFIIPREKIDIELQRIDLHRKKRRIQQMNNQNNMIDNSNNNPKHL